MWNLMGIEADRGRIDFAVTDPRMFSADSPAADQPKNETALFFLEGDGGVSSVGITRYPPGYELPPHSHGSDYMAIIIEGSVKVGPREYRAGEIRIQEAGSIYGPERVGPDGLVQIAVFATAKGLPMDLSREKDRPTWEPMNDWLRLLAAGERTLPPGVSVGDASSEA